MMEKIVKSVLIFTGAIVTGSVNGLLIHKVLFEMNFNKRYNIK
jgi:hypothetical protein